MLSREQREELKFLSKYIFGVTSKYERWTDGSYELVTETVEEDIPGEDGKEATKRSFVRPKLDVDGAKQLVFKKYTFEETKAIFLGYKEKLDQYREEIKKKQEQEQLQKDINAKAGGSTI